MFIHWNVHVFLVKFCYIDSTNLHTLHDQKYVDSNIYIFLRYYYLFIDLWCFSKIYRSKVQKSST